MYDIEKLLIASSVSEACEMLQKNEKAEIICGGSDVLIKTREGRMAGCTLVSIHDIEELRGVSLLADGTIKIGPATVFSHITKNEIIQKYIPVLGYAADQVGGPQLRNMGTIGGNVCNGVTSADTASTLLTLNAELELTDTQSTRIVKLEDFYTGPGRTVREHSELLTAIYIRKNSYEDFGGSYFKYAQRNAMDIATLGCAVNVKLTPDKKYISDLRIAFGVAAPTPVRCHKVEEQLTGKTITEAAAQIGELCQAQVSPRTSWRASKEFRLQLVKELAYRELLAAAKNAGGDINA